MANSFFINCLPHINTMVTLSSDGCYGAAT